MAVRELLDPDYWGRRGRGGAFAFYATDQEVPVFLRDLPSEWQPYSMVCPYSVRVAGEWQKRVLRAPLQRVIEEFGALVAQGVREFWLRSDVLTPPMPPDPWKLDMWCSINGLISLRHGDTHKERRPTKELRKFSWIGMIYGAVSGLSGETRDFRQERRVFEALKKRIRASLTHTSVQVDRAGRQWENPFELMTTAAAELSRTGFFDRCAGSPVEAKGARGRAPSRRRPDSRGE